MNLFGVRRSYSLERVSLTQKMTRQK